MNLGNSIENVLNAVPGAATLLGGLFGGGYKNPANAAQPYLNQIAPTMQNYYSPYVKAGQQSLSDLMGQFKSLVSNPGQQFSQMGQGFQHSPSYNFDFQQAMNAANIAAATGGMLGTPQHQQDAASIASQLANRDFYNYMGNVQNLYGTGLSGLSGINQQGYNASSDLATNLANTLMNQGGMAYAGQQNANQASADRWKNIIGGATGMIGSFFPPE